MDAPQVKLVMIIDDNEIDNLINRKILQNNKFAEEIQVFESALLALECLKTYTQFPQIIFVDVKMPEMDGFQFLNEYELFDESLKNTCKIFMVSSTVDPDDLYQINSNKNVTKLISKPLTNISLKELNLHS